MLSSVEIITTPTVDTPGSAIVLDFPDRKYLIGNIHEGLTRAFIERGTRLSRVTDIFITGRTEWKSIGGLLGTVLSVADVRMATAAAVAADAEQKAANLRERGITRKRSEKGLRAKIRDNGFLDQVTEGQDAKFGDEFANSALTIHGGPNITHSLAAARKFIFRKGTPLRVDEFQESSQRPGSDREWKPDWVDERVRVWSMAIAPNQNDERGSPLASESPLKRRYDDFAELETNAAAETITGPNLASADSSAEDQRVRALAVAHMFDSAWRSDQLEEVFLAALPVPVTAKIFMRDQITQEIRPYSGPMPDGVTSVPPVKVLVRKPWPGALIRDLPSTQPSKLAMSYIFRNHTQRGKFQPEKAKLLKVPAGPLWAELSQGRSVQSTDGQTISPDMVLLAAREGSGFAVVDIPSPEYVQNLVERPEWQAPAVMNGVEMIVWILGRSVGQNKQLQDFMCHHGNLRHIISSQDYCPNQISFDSGASGAIQRNQINPIQYPFPVYNNNPRTQLRQSEYGQYPNTEFIEARRGVKLMLTPSVYFNNKIIPPLNTTRVLQKTPPDVLELARAAREIIDSKSCQEEILGQNIPSPDAEIICLGTGSAVPSKYRNVSSTLLRVPGSGSYLLDCGENTLGQLRRIYSSKQLRELFRDLRLIWISHLHADHHLGLPSVIKAWYEARHGWKTENPEDPTTPSTNHGTENPQDPTTPSTNHGIENPQDSTTLSTNHGTENPQDSTTLSTNHGTENPQDATTLSTNHGTENPQDSTTLSTNHGTEAAEPISKNDSLILVSSRRMHGYLKEYSQVEDIGLRYVTRLSSLGATENNPCSVLHHPDQDMDPIEIKEILRTAGILDLQSCYVRHCDEAQAVSLTFPTGFKFSYSGDCRPSKIFAQIGKDSTVLLHEATFDDEMEADARIKKHSTTSEAIGVGVAMGARRILLTHFSQRYQKLPVMSKIKGLHVRLEGSVDASDEMDGADPDIALTASGSTELDARITQSLTSTNHELATSDVGSSLPQTTLEADLDLISQPPPSDLKIGIAFDYMRVRVGDIIHLEKFTPAFLKLFKEQEPDEQVVAQEKDWTNQKEEKGEAPWTPTKTKLKQMGGKKAGKETGNGMPKKSADRARSPSARERPSEDEQAELKSTIPEVFTTPPPSNMDSVSM